MELRLYVDDLYDMRIDEKSCYNHNYYKLPITMNDCDILFGESDDDYTTLWALGKFKDDEFEFNCWLGESFICYDTPEYIDLKQANKDMIWT
mgnify:CR=1 FL=1